jgi:predicted transposase YbfD/YdcC
MKNIWKGIQHVIHVERRFVRKGKETQSHHYYISSLSSDNAELFANAIRGHWSIENRLHWVKDVIQYEDDSGIKKGNGIETLSILKNVAINISRELGFDSIKGATIHFASNVKELMEYFRT